MALIDCPECEHKVRDQANACPACGRRLTDRLAKLELDIEINRIDFEWERTRKNYMVHRLFLGSSVPTRSMAVRGMGFDCLLIVLFTTAAVITLSDDARLFFLVLMGVVLLFRLCVSIYVYMRARLYEQAEARYVCLRDAVKATHGTGAQD